MPDVSAMDLAPNGVTSLLVRRRTEVSRLCTAILGDRVEDVLHGCGQRLCHVCRSGDGAQLVGNAGQVPAGTIVEDGDSGVLREQDEPTAEVDCRDAAYVGEAAAAHSSR